MEGEGYFIGALAAQITVAAVVLLIGKLPALRGSRRGVYMTAGALAVLLTLSQFATTGIHTEYELALQMVASIWVCFILWWGYRRTMEVRASGWLRIGAVLSLLWGVPGTFIFATSGIDGADPWFGFACLVVPVGIIWGGAWAVRWIAAGFRRPA